LNSSERIYTTSADVGVTVRVDYVLKIDGKVKDTSIEKEAKNSGIFKDYRQYEPMSFVLGKGEVIPGFEKNILGMKTRPRRLF